MGGERRGARWEWDESGRVTSALRRCSISAGSWRSPVQIARRSRSTGSHSSCATCRGGGGGVGGYGAGEIGGFGGGSYSTYVSKQASM